MILDDITIENDESLLNILISDISYNPEVPPINTHNRDLNAFADPGDGESIDYRVFIIAGEHTQELEYTIIENIHEEIDAIIREAYNTYVEDSCDR